MINNSHANTGFSFPPPFHVPYRSLHIYHVCEVTRICNDTEKKVKELESKENERIEVMDDYCRMHWVSCPIEAVSY
jgi:hypothetical protein